MVITVVPRMVAVCERHDRPLDTFWCNLAECSTLGLFANGCCLCCLERLNDKK